MTPVVVVVVIVRRMPYIQNQLCRSNVFLVTYTTESRRGNPTSETVVLLAPPKKLPTCNGFSHIQSLLLFPEPARISHSALRVVNQKKTKGSSFRKKNGQKQQQRRRIVYMCASIDSDDGECKSTRLSERLTKRQKRERG